MQTPAIKQKRSTVHLFNWIFPADLGIYGLITDHLPWQVSLIILILVVIASLLIMALVINEVAPR